MDQRKSRRHLKRIKETGMARLTAAFMLAVIILTLEISYILSGASGKRAFANEAEDEEVIVIPVNDSNTQFGEKVSGNESTASENKAEEEPPSPVVKIGITEPAGWHRKSAEVKFSAEDIGDSGDFTIASVRAKIGNGGSWTDVTDSMSLELSEDCVVYVEITDTKGRTYSKNKKISCFDNTKPTLNAAVNNGNLTIETNDNDSGVKAVYVNGFEFTSLNEGTLNIRMQQFDTGYENFAIQAMDYAGNMSDTYRVNNPYYKRKDASGKEAKVLPDSAEATKPAEATATVTDHIKTDEAGNTLANLFSNALSAAGTVSDDSKSEEKKKSLAEADCEEKPETVPGKGREFYTIEAKTGKVFYLIIDRIGENEEVRFVTDITENDLLNVTEEYSNTLPQNAAMSDTDAVIMESALPNNNAQIDDVPEEKETDLFGRKDTEEILSVDEVSKDGAPGDTGEEKKNNSWIWKIIIFLIAAMIVIGIKALDMMARKRDGDYSEDEDPEGEEDTGDDTAYDDDGNVADV
ncbi:MAG: DUF4366 domain-containing protein, partial [Lachnospiraceae bacterium]|nr:DUF4366 domain-containing protein [Lachnospiraceae bacterium]